MIKSIFASAVGLGLALTSLAASAEYKVWYDDNINGFYEYGAISAGNTKLVPPAWACGMRFTNPDYYRWVGDIPYVSGDFTRNVHVWIPKPGCPQPAQILIEYQDHSRTFSPAPNTHYFGITTHAAANWINAQGKIPACNCLPNFDYKVASPSWKVLPLSFDDVKAQVLDPNRRSTAHIALRALRNEVDRLGTELEGQIALRRRTNLPDREASVRALEDGAARHIALATIHLDNAMMQLSAGNHGGTHTEIDVGRENTVEAMEEAEAALDIVMPQRGE